MWVNRWWFHRKFSFISLYWQILKKIIFTKLSKNLRKNSYKSLKMDIKMRNFFRDYSHVLSDRIFRKGWFCELIEEVDSGGNSVVLGASGLLGFWIDNFGILRWCLLGRSFPLLWGFQHKFSIDNVGLWILLLECFVVTFWAGKLHSYSLYIFFWDNTD